MSDETAGPPAVTARGSADPSKEIRRLDRTVRRLEVKLEQVERMRDTNARVIDRLMRELEAERERSRDLLLNVLPQRIVERLDAGETRIADRHDRVAIVFSDFVGFTRIAAGRSASDLVDDLNRLFSAFDERTAALGVEKIKTIGDAYLAAAGLADGGPDPVVAAADLALGMREVVHATGPPWAIRIGIHIGPVEAGIIGTRTFAYDVWGDTVNVASRLESTAGPDRIHVSGAVARALRSRYELVPRGRVHLKGKGVRSTWTLVGRRP